MLGLFKKKKPDEASSTIDEAPIAESATQSQPSSRKGFFTRLRQGLSKTRGHFSEGIAKALLGKKEIDDELLEEIETQLLMADVGVDATQSILTNLTRALKRGDLRDGESVLRALKDSLTDLITPLEKPLALGGSKKPFVILMAGINGAGKTTTIGKLANFYKASGLKVMLAAGDTFRAAAVEQLKVWGERNEVPVIAQASGADSASVVFDALEAAKARDVDVLIADTAGRLHTQLHLMEELKKIKRVMAKLDSEAPHEVMLVLDASIGQNALSQAREFNQAIGVTGLAMTKLDGSAKGGILFAIANELAIPFRYIGVGEGQDDLRPFEAEAFVNALFD